ncbi:MAG: hypothetical protein HOY71_03590 [Nonomuraea sp.]|nr:hypothetical protein [Nonomuraea sp.]
MTSKGYVDAPFKAFEDCRQRVRWAAKRFDVDDTIKETKSQMPKGNVESALFGTVTGADTLATSVNHLWGGINVEFALGKMRLEATEGALDEVESNLRKAGKASGE